MKKVVLFYTIAEYKKFIEDSRILNSEEYDFNKMRLFAERSEKNIENKTTQKLKEICDKIVPIKAEEKEQAEQKEPPIPTEELSTNFGTENSGFIDGSEDNLSDNGIYNYSVINEINQYHDPNDDIFKNIQINSNH